MESAGDWCLLESDPGVFTHLIKKFGTTGVQVEEMWSLDEEAFEDVRPVHGLIFLFKCVDDEETSGKVLKGRRAKHIYFAKQVINNACATQAVLSILLNFVHEDVDLGPELTKLKEFSMPLDPQMKGLALSNSHIIRSAHNSLAQQPLFEFDPKMPSKQQDSYHYVSFMQIDGRLFELDGLQEGPIDHGPLVPDLDWIEFVRPVIMKRINVYSEGEIHFNLMALVSDRKMRLERKLTNIRKHAEIWGENEDIMETEVPHLKMLLEVEEVKKARYEQEMARRRHNYMPFIINLLKILAEEKKLTPLYEKAKERASKKSSKKMKV